MATWNVRTMYRGGALGEVLGEMEKYNIDILAVQETRWIGTDTFDTRTHTIMHSGNEKHHEFGVAFIVNQRLKNQVIGFKAVNERICILRIKTKFFNISIINVHAETEDKDEATKDTLYDKLEHIYDTIPSKDKNGYWRP